jgi:hypothetical protein
MSKYEIQKVGIMNRKWMEKYWHPKIIVNEFEKIYDEL